MAEPWETLDFFLTQWKTKRPFSLWIFGISVGLFIIFAIIYMSIYFVAPLPRAPLASETKYKTLTPKGAISDSQDLPHWEPGYWKSRETKDIKEQESDTSGDISDAEVLVSLVIPAYNEQDRLGPMLKEAIEFLSENYGEGDPQKQEARRRKSKSDETKKGKAGWEILIVSDGSTDRTESVAFDCARAQDNAPIRFVTLAKNRGKGGAVVHGMRHVRGEYVIFADADGASRFSDLGKLIEACDQAKDSRGRAVAIGSRAHLVGSPQVVNRSALRNFLMRCFHLFIWMFTPRATSRIRDTQCGFKLFSRATLPHIVPHMYSEGWIFDVEMLMLAERAEIPMVEVAIGWHEVKGSKLNVVWDSVGMAWGLFVLRAAWAVGVYSTLSPSAEALKMADLKPGNFPQIRYKGPIKPY